MGTVIRLGLGNLEIDWGKNNSFNSHSALFKKDDLKVWECRDFDEDSDDEGAYIVKKRQALVSKLANVLPRLELLGYTNNTAEYLYYWPVKQGYLNKSNLIPFKTIKTALTRINIEKLPFSYKNWDYDFGEFARKNIADQLKLRQPKFGSHIYFEESLENLDPYIILRILAGNENNLDTHLVWDFQELVENGWSRKADICAPLSSDKKFILITEGTSDTKILKTAIKLLRPNIADFFTFIDMENGYPFGGTGNLYNFCRGLVKIGVLNNVVVIYDNDTEGSYMYSKTMQLDLPSNIRVMKLPVLDEFASFDTIGPSGESTDNINGKAVAIECFLDLIWKNEKKAMVRWTGFQSNLGQYQGELIDKNSYTDNFLKLNKIDKKYNYSKLEQLLNSIYDECVKLAEAKMLDGKL